MTNPKISIIVPVYNGSENIIRCLESITKQDYRDIEIIVVDVVLLEVVRKGLDGNQGNGIAVSLEIVVVSLEIGAVANGRKIILFDFLISCSSLNVIPLVINLSIK